MKYCQILWIIWSNILIFVVLIILNKSQPDLFSEQFYLQNKPSFYVWYAKQIWSKRQQSKPMHRTYNWWFWSQLFLDMKSDWLFFYIKFLEMLNLYPEFYIDTCCALSILMTEINFQSLFFSLTSLLCHVRLIHEEY